MLNTREEKFHNLLFRRKKHIKTRIPVIETAAFIASFLITFLLSDFPDASVKVKVLVSVLSIVYIASYAMSLYSSNYSLDAFYRDICSAAEKERGFSLVLLRDTSGLFPANYLLSYDRRWRCWLFPYVRTSNENDSQSVSRFVEQLLKTDKFTVRKTAEQDFTKHSVSANLQKTYHHTFYLVELDASKTSAGRKTFAMNGGKYRWMSVSRMKENRRTFERNHDNIRFVEENFGF